MSEIAGRVLLVAAWIMLDTAITSAGLLNNLYHFWDVSNIDMGHMGPG